MSESAGKDIEHEIQLVRDRLGRADVNRDSIALLAVRLIELRNPGTRVEMTAEHEIKIVDSDGGSGSMHLHNLWIECEQTPGERAQIVERYVRILAPSKDETGRQYETTENIVALVRDSVYRDFVKDEDRSLITSHLVADLWVVFAVDKPESTLVLGKERAIELGLDSASLLNIGKQNIDVLLGDIEFTPYGSCFTIGCEMPGYASSTLLLDYVWEQATPLVDGDVVVAVPARDSVIFAGSADAKGLQELRDEARHVATNGHHVISETLLRRVDGQWKLFA